MNILVQTNSTLLNTGVLLLRCITGLILFMAGAGKVLKWFGGFGMEMTVKFFGQSGITEPWAYISSYTEFIGGFLLMIGLFTRPTAFAIMINMLVAAIISWPKGFLAGAAYPLSLMVNAVIILLTGPLAYSLDSWLIHRDEVNRKQPV